VNPAAAVIRPSKTDAGLTAVTWLPKIRILIFKQNAMTINEKPPMYALTQYYDSQTLMNNEKYNKKVKSKTRSTD